MTMGAATRSKLGSPAQYIQISYYFRFMPDSLSFGILQKSLSVGPDATAFTDIIKWTV